MKLNKVLFLLTAMTMFIACKEEEGTYPGNDTEPAVSVFQLKAEGEGENPDCDAKIRIATNNQVTDVYYMVEKEETKAANLEKMGETGYMDYVIEKGQKVDNISASQASDVLIKEAYGKNMITIVGVGKGKKVANEIPFFGIKWNPIGIGTFDFPALGVVGVQSKFDVRDDTEWYRMLNRFMADSYFIFQLEGDEVLMDKQTLQPGLEMSGKGYIDRDTKIIHLNSTFYQGGDAIPGGESLIYLP